MNWKKFSKVLIIIVFMLCMFGPVFIAVSTRHTRLSNMSASIYDHGYSTEEEYSDNLLSTEYETDYVTEIPVDTIEVEEYKFKHLVINDIESCYDNKICNYIYTAVDEYCNHSKDKDIQFTVAEESFKADAGYIIISMYISNGEIIDVIIDEIYDGWTWEVR